jgi:hypothetical protein
VPLEEQRVHRSVAHARNDLDLLIARADSERFATVLHRLGFKLVFSSSGLPGVSSYYGYDADADADADADRLVHVHAHYQLVVGDDLTKNYRIPLEEAFLESATYEGEFRVPAPELEYIMLVIRLVLKHLTWDAVVAHLARIPDSARGARASAGAHRPRARRRDARAPPAVRAARHVRRLRSSAGRRHLGRHPGLQPARRRAAAVRAGRAGLTCG